MNSTTVPARPARLPWRADFLTALLGIALQAVAAFSVVIASGLTSGAGRADGGTGRAGQVLDLGLGTLACLTLLVALLLRAKAPITAALHLLLSGALLLAILTAPPVSKSRPPSRTPAPTFTGTR